jgi:hypothetical protein
VRQLNSKEERRVVSLTCRSPATRGRPVPPRVGWRLTSSRVSAQASLRPSTATGVVIRERSPGLVGSLIIAPRRIAIQGLAASLTRAGMSPSALVRQHGAWANIHQNEIGQRRYASVRISTLRAIWLKGSSTRSNSVGGSRRANQTRLGNGACARTALGARTAQAAAPTWQSAARRLIDGTSSLVPLQAESMEI